MRAFLTKRLDDQWTEDVHTSHIAKPDLEDVENMTITEIKHRYLQLKRQVPEVVIEPLAEPLRVPGEQLDDRNGQNRLTFKVQNNYEPVDQWHYGPSNRVLPVTSEPPRNLDADRPKTPEQAHWEISPATRRRIQELELLQSKPRLRFLPDFSSGINEYVTARDLAEDADRDYEEIRSVWVCKPPAAKPNLLQPCRACYYKTRYVSESSAISHLRHIHFGLLVHPKILRNLTSELVERRDLLTGTIDLVQKQQLPREMNIRSGSEVFTARKIVRSSVVTG